MNRILKVTRLQLVNPTFTFLPPLVILGVVVVIMWLIAFAIQRAGADPASQTYINGMQNNTGLLSAFGGFLVYYGVQAVATTFPIALVLGNTRRAFAFGTAIANAVYSAYVAVLLLLVHAIERATNHFGIGAYITDVALLGKGEPLKLLGSAFLGSMLLLTVGGLFAALWVRFGAKGAVALGLTVALAVALALVWVAPNLATVAAWVTAPRIVGVLLALTTAALLGTWAAMRATPVR